MRVLKVFGAILFFTPFMAGAQEQLNCSRETFTSTQEECFKFIDKCNKYIDNYNTQKDWFSYEKGKCVKHIHKECDDCFTNIAYKPIIYLYPTQTTNVTVQLGKPENLMFTYPKYQGFWRVQAEPNGNLKDLKTGRNLYALYWEGMETEKRYPKEGFIVAGKDTIPFLEEKLAQLGLNEREADEFIIYWLPKLEQNPYNFIRFKTQAEQDKAMPLTITPTPDTVIRVMMEFDEVDNSIPMRPQQLPPTPKRSGFTVVEWGGMETDLD